MTGMGWQETTLAITAAVTAWASIFGVIAAYFIKRQSTPDQEVFANVERIIGKYQPLTEQLKQSREDFVEIERNFIEVDPITT
jgi:hypothetical protein